MADRTSGYAQAVVALATAEDALDTVETELLTVARTIEGSTELRDRLTDLQIPVSQRLKFVEADALTAAHPATRAALAMLIAAERVLDLEPITRQVSESAAEARDRDLAEVWVATSLDDGQRAQLQQALERATGKSLDLRIHVDPSVVGGVRAQVGDTVIDGSLAKRLEDVKTRIGA
jgi:F-type H+-transporting ATPase subunit delta